MNPEEVQRKLTTIFSTDVEGYSRLMADDETATIRTLTACKKVIADRIENAGGRVVDSPGDNLLAEFGSVVHAVQCAAEIQKELGERNEALPEARKMRFRIGINVGDVVVEEDRLYGDGVNIAARLEGLAEGGGICISGDAYRQVRGRLPFGFEDMGEHRVKNIPDPVHAYGVRPDSESSDAPPPSATGRPGRGKWSAVAALAAAVIAGAAAWYIYGGPSRPAPSPSHDGKPSIAVLPFANLSGEKEQEYFADGMTDDLITDLSKISGLFVIARNSAFTYKGKAVKVQRVARELGVRYVLEGSVRRAGGQVRINTKLIDTQTGGNIWAERYDRKLDDIFALQDAITREVVGALKLRLTRADRERQGQGPKTKNPEAYDLVLRARKLMTRFDRKAARRGRELLERAVRLDPGYAEAHTLLGLYHFDEWRLWGENRNNNLARATELARTSIRLNPRAPAPHVLLAQIHQFRRAFDAAIQEADAALALKPNDAVTLANLGSMLRYAHRPKEAAEVIERAMRLDPYHPPNYLEWVGDAYLFLGRLDDCIQAVERGIALDPDFVALHVVAAKCYAANGDKEKAREQGAAVLRVNPGFTLRAFAAYVPFSDDRDRQYNLKMLRIAGLPD